MRCHNDGWSSAGVYNWRELDVYDWSVIDSI